MNRLLTISLLALLSLGLLPQTSMAKGVESQGQLLVAFGRTFADIEITEDVTAGLFASTLFLMPLRSTPQLFGYFGPEITYRDANIKLLTGTLMTSDGGMSVLASIWYNQGMPHDLNLFLEADAYFPIDGKSFGHESRQFYTLANFSWEVNEDSGLGFGLMQENFFDEDGNWYEAAIGPVLNFSKANIWIAYDFTPEVDGDHSIVFRFSVTL